MVNGSSYLRVTSRTEGLNVSENSQAKLDVSARAGFTTSDLVTQNYLRNNNNNKFLAEQKKKKKKKKESSTSKIFNKTNKIKTKIINLAMYKLNMNQIDLIKTIYICYVTHNRLRSLKSTPPPSCSLLGVGLILKLSPVQETSRQG